MATDRNTSTRQSVTAVEELGSLLSRRAERMIASLRGQADILVEDRACLFRGGTGRGSARELGIERRLRLKAHKKDDRREDKPDRDADAIDVAEQMRREVREQQLGSLLSEATEVLPWQRVLRQKRRIVLLGEPGGGKSYSTRLELATRLDRAAITLEDGVALPDDFPLLAWGTAEMLADQPYASTSKTQRDDYLRASFRNGHVAAEIASDRNSLIVIDALDEMSPSKNKAFTRNLKQLCKDFSGTVIVTCRVGQWVGRANWIAADSFEVATFEPLQGREQLALYRKIAGQLGGSENPDIDSFQSLLRKRSFLSIDFGTPLLLTFAALLNLEGDLVTDETVTPSDLYGHVLTRLLRGTWMENAPDWCADEVAVENIRESLGLAAWKLFQLEESSERSGVRNLFSLAELKECGVDEKSLRELQEVGLLVLAGKNRTGKLCVAFAHRSLLEFLAAEGLSAKQNREDLEKSVLMRSERLEDSIFWLLHEEWEPVLGFLHGLLPAAFRGRLEKVENRDDFFDSVWKLRRRLGFSLTIEEVEYEGRAQRETLTALIGACNTKDETRRLEFANEKYCPVSSSAAEVLGYISNDTAVHALIELCQDEDEMVRSCAAEAMGNTGSETTIASLIGLCEDDDFMVRFNAIESLGKIGSDRAIFALIGLCRHEDEMVRSCAAEALGNSGSEKAIASLIGLCRDEGDHVRSRAAKALGEIGGERVTSALIELCRDKSDEVRSSAAAALGSIGGDNAVFSLTRLLLDESELVRRSCVASLRDIGTEEALIALIDFCNANPPENFIRQVRSARMFAEEALEDFGREDAVIQRVIYIGKFNFRIMSRTGKTTSSDLISDLIKTLEITTGEPAHVEFTRLQSILDRRDGNLASFPWKEHRLIQKRCRRAFLPYKWKLK